MREAEPSSRHCLFCGSTERLTREHVWPDWLADTLPPGDWWTAVRRGETLRAAIDAEPIRGPNHNGGRARLTLRKVCTRCNEGWMSKLEHLAKPLVVGLLREPVLDTTPRSTATLDRWATKTAMVMAGQVSGHDPPAEVC